MNSRKKGARIRRRRSKRSKRSKRRRISQLGFQNPSFEEEFQGIEGVTRRWQVVRRRYFLIQFLVCKTFLFVNSLLVVHIIPSREEFWWFSCRSKNCVSLLYHPALWPISFVFSISFLFSKSCQNFLSISRSSRSPGKPSTKNPYFSCLKSILFC